MILAPVALTQRQTMVCEWCSEHIHRHLCCSAPSTRDWVSADAKGAKDRPHVRLRSWLVVSIHHISRKPQRSLLIADSVCVVSMLRLNALVVLSRNMTDFSWYGPETAYWSSIEINVAILCACAPVLKPLVTRVFPRFGSGYQYGHSRGQGTTSGGAMRLGFKAEVQHISNSRSRDPFDDECALTETPTSKSKSEWEMVERPAAPVRSKSKRMLHDERLRNDDANPEGRTIKVTTAISQEISDEEMKTEQAARALYSKYARYPSAL